MKIDMRFRQLPLYVALTGLFGLGYVTLVHSQAEKKVSETEAKIIAALPEKKAEPKQKRKLLVFSVTNGFRHPSIETGKVAFTLLGEKTGAFEAVISDDLANFEKDKINQFDAICFLSTTLEVFKPHPSAWGTLNEQQKADALARDVRLKQNLLEFIKSGKGFVGIHAATDTFYEWAEYGEMIGGYFDGHPWSAGTPVQINVEAGKKDHPIVAGLEGVALNFNEEIYQHKAPYDSSKVEMLLRLDPEKSAKVGGIKRTDNDFGVSWIKPYGKGRVFYCSLGHNDHMFWNNKVLGVYLNGIQWALGDLEIK